MQSAEEGESELGSIELNTPATTEGGSSGDSDGGSSGLSDGLIVLDQPFMDGFKLLTDLETPFI